jgi:hypothetical protein
VAEALVPDAEVEVVGEALDEFRLGLLVDEAPGRLGAADGRRVIVSGRTASLPPRPSAIRSSEG